MNHFRITLRRTVTTALCALVVLGAIGVSTGTPTVQAAPQPTFSARIVSFRAINESGIDWLGSDEVYVGITDRSDGRPYQLAWTLTRDSVDSGDTKTIAAGEGCITSNDLVYDATGDGHRQPREGDVSLCFGSRIPTFEIVLYDQETDWTFWEFNPNCLLNSCSRLNNADELLFRGNYQYSGPTLMTLMPNVYDTKTLTLRSQVSTNASYTVNIEFVRQS